MSNNNNKINNLKNVEGVVPSEVIPSMLRWFIRRIPENGAVKVSCDLWDSVTCKRNKCIGKINGRLEFFEYDNNTDWLSVFIWDYADEPGLWEENFNKDLVPCVYDVFMGVFV